MLKRFANFLLQKRRHAAIVALACGILPAAFASFSMVIVAFVTLCRGSKEGAIVMLWAMLPFLAHAYVDKSYLVLSVALLGFILVWGASALLRSTTSWVLVLQVGAVLGMTAVFAVHGCYPDIVQWWAGHIQHYAVAAEQSAGLKITSQQIAAEVHLLASVATGFEVSLILVLAMLKLLFARWWQAIAFNPGGLREELHQIHLGYLCAALFALLVIVAYAMSSMIVVEAMFPVGLVLVIAGLSLLHCWLKPYKYALITLVGFYTIVIIFPKTLFLAILLGMIDSGFNLRKKMSS